MWFLSVIGLRVGQLNGNGQRGMLQIDAPRRKFLATPLEFTVQCARVNDTVPITDWWGGYMHCAECCRCSWLIVQFFVLKRLVRGLSSMCMYMLKHLPCPKLYIFVWYFRTFVFASKIVMECVGKCGEVCRSQQISYLSAVCAVSKEQRNQFDIV